LLFLFPLYRVLYRLGIHNSLSARKRKRERERERQTDTHTYTIQGIILQESCNIDLFPQNSPLFRIHKFRKEGKEGEREGERIRGIEREKRETVMVSEAERDRHEGEDRQK